MHSGKTGRERKEKQTGKEKDKQRDKETDRQREQSTSTKVRVF